MKNSFRTFLFMLLFSIGLISNGPALANGSDIADHWAAIQLQEWLDKGIVKGYSDGRFKPDDAITRAEFATLVNKAFGFIREADVNYSDVSPEAWYYREIRVAAEAGYIQGYGDGTMKPERHITREEAAVMLGRILQLENSTGQASEFYFTDKDFISKWSIDAVKRVAAAGYITGYPDQTFKPQKNISHAEAVVVLSKGTGEIMAQAGTYGSETELQTYAGNVTITAGQVKLVNAVIQGDLLLAEAVGNEDVFLENVVVEGKVRIAGGGAQSIYVTGTSELIDVYVNKKTGTIRIVLRDEVQIEQMILLSQAIVINETVNGKLAHLYVRNEVENEVELWGDFEEIEVDSLKGILRLLEGNVGKLTVTDNAAESEMTLDDRSFIEHLILNEAIHIHGYGRIGLVEINENGVMIEWTPENILIKDGLKATIEGKDYPPEPASNIPSENSGASNEDDDLDEGGDSNDDENQSPVSVTGITLDQTDITLEVGETSTLTATVYPANATNKSVTWSSDNESVATVANGVVTAQSAGTATITVTTVDGGYTSTLQITVVVPVTSVTLDQTDLTLEVGETAALTATVYPANATNKSVSWSSDDESVATVVDGVVTAQSAGTATITVTTADGGYTSTLQITVVVPVTSVTLDQTDMTLEVGETVALTATVYPANATNKNVTWSSDNESVATVDDGIVTAVALGTATITVTTADGGYTASSLIIVGNGRADVDISTADIPVIAQYPFALSIRNAFDEMEEKIDGNAQVTVTVEDGEESVIILDEPVIFEQGDATVTPLRIEHSGAYDFTITIEGIRDPIMLQDIEVVQVLEAVLHAQTEDELFRALSALGILKPAEFDSDRIEMNHLQAYLDDFAVSQPQTAADVQDRVNVVNDLKTAPQFVAGFPEIDELQDIWFDFKIMIDRAGTVYYMVVEAGADPPTAEEVKAGAYGGAAVIAAGSKSLDLGSYGWGTATGLAAETEYNLYLAAESDHGALSAHPVMLTVTTIPYIPAAFADGYPQIDELSDNHFSMRMRATKDSKMYYLLVPRGAAAPTSEEVKSQSHPQIIRSGLEELPINTIRTMYFRVLSPSTEYDLYTVIEDTTMNTLQPVPTKLQITTLPDEAPFIVSGPTILSQTETAIRFWLFLNKPGKIYYMLVEEDEAPPTAQEVVAGAPYGDVIPTKSGISNLGQNLTIDAEELTSDTEYVIYIVTESMNNSFSEQPTSVTASTLPYQPAQFMSNNPYANNEDVDYFYLGMNLTKPGNVYYLVVPRDAQAPTAAQIQEGSPYGEVTPVVAASVAADPTAYELVKGLWPGTEYDIYMVIEDLLVGLQSPVKLQAQTIPDSPPGYWGEPHVYDISDSSIKLQLGISRAGYGYYLLQLEGGPAPTSQQIKENPSGVIDLTHTGWGAWREIHNLLPETNYEIYVAVESIYGALQAEPIKLEFKTLEESEPPVFIADSLLVLDVTSSSFYLYYKLDKAGTVHYIMVGPEAQEPTAAQVVMGEGADGSPVIRSGSADYILSHVYPSFYFKELTPNTTYVVYIVGKGLGSNTSAVHRVEVTTEP